MIEQAVNGYVKKIQYLPNNFEVKVDKSWCFYAMMRLEFLEYFELLDVLRKNIEMCENENNNLRYINMSVDIIKKILSVCGDMNFSCIIPFDYNMIIESMLCKQLGDIKVQIEVLISEDKIDDVFVLIDNINNIELKNYALLCARNCYNRCTEKIVEDIKISRKRTLMKLESNLG